MKRILLASVGLLALGTATSAVAADLPRAMPVKAPMMAPVVYNWTGFYVGAHVGYGWANKDWGFPDTGTATSHSADGFLGGGQVGFNYQTGAWVFGLEGDLSWANLNGQSVCPNPAANCRTEINWLGTFTGRVGYAFDRALLYVKGGVAWVDEDYFVRFPAAPASDETAGGVRTGWTLGVGLEYGFWNNWSAKLEYDYMDFGTDSYRLNRIATGVFVENLDVKQHVHAVKLGINYRFGAGPVVARY